LPIAIAFPSLIITFSFLNRTFVQPLSAKVRFKNENVIINEGKAMAMGNYFFTNSKGEEIKVEYSFGYITDSNRKLRINLHHSSMPASIE
jgi:hypothetical protein